MRAAHDELEGRAAAALPPLSTLDEVSRRGNLPSVV